MNSVHHLIRSFKVLNPYGVEKREFLGLGLNIVEDEKKNAGPLC